jgi:hypothetical protein
MNQSVWNEKANIDDVGFLLTRQIFSIRDWSIFGGIAKIVGRH